MMYLNAPGDLTGPQPVWQLLANWTGLTEATTNEEMETGLFSKTGSKKIIWINKSSCSLRGLFCYFFVFSFVLSILSIMIKVSKSFSCVTMSAGKTLGPIVQLKQPIRLSVALLTHQLLDFRTFCHSLHRSICQLIGKAHKYICQLLTQL